MKTHTKESLMIVLLIYIYGTILIRRIITLQGAKGSTVLKPSYRTCVLGALQFSCIQHSKNNPTDRYSIDV